MDDNVKCICGLNCDWFKEVLHSASSYYRGVQAYEAPLGWGRPRKDSYPLGLSVSHPITSPVFYQRLASDRLLLIDEYQPEDSVVLELC